jgi:hypothetical protein
VLGIGEPLLLGSVMWKGELCFGSLLSKGRELLIYAMVFLLSLGGDTSPNFRTSQISEKCRVRKAQNFRARGKDRIG